MADANLAFQWVRVFQAFADWGITVAVSWMAAAVLMPYCLLIGTLHGILQCRLYFNWVRHGLLGIPIMPGTSFYSCYSFLF